VAGDTLYSIAQKHSLTVDHLMSMNNLQTNLIDGGVRLRVK
jgi:LysM repeat protein